MDTTSRERMTEVAVSIGVDIDQNLNAFTQLHAITEHLESRPWFWRDTLPKLNEIIADLVVDQLPEWDELDALERYFGIFDLLPVYDMPPQPGRGLQRYHNGPIRWWVEYHFRLLRFFKLAGKRIGDTESDQPPDAVPANAYPEGAGPDIWWRWFAVSLLGTVQHFGTWINDGRLSYEPNVGQRLLAAEFAFFRTNHHLNREVRGSDSWIDCEDVRFVLEELIPRVRPSYPAAAAEALNLLIEWGATLLTEPVAQGISAAGRPGNEQMAAVIDNALAVEKVLWMGLGRATRALAAESCRTWIRSQYVDFDPDKELAALIGSPTLPGPEVERLCLEAPIFSVTILAVLREIRFAPLKRIESSGLSTEQLLMHAMRPIFHDLGNPAKLPCRLRYRSFVRAELLGHPPVLSWIEYLLINRREIPALTTLQAFWRANARVIFRWDEDGSIQSTGFDQWKSDLRRLALKVLTERADMIEAGEWSFGYGHAGVFPSHLVAASETPSEVLYRDKQSHYLRYFRMRPPSAEQTASPDFSRILERSAELETNLLVVVAMADKIVASHHTASTGKWDHGETFSGVSRVALARILGAANLPDVKGNEVLGRLMAELGVDSAKELVWKLSEILVNKCDARFELGARTCLVLSPELRTLPIVSHVATVLADRYPGEAAVGELRIDLGKPVSTNNACGYGFCAFVDEQLSSTEIEWPALGIPGEIRSEYGPDDVCQALGNGTPIVHMITHGVIDEDAPVFSCIRAGQEPLFSFEIALTGVTARLLVLNTCSSGSGGYYVSGSAYSPAECALVAGAEAVVANLYPVETDLATRFGVALQQTLAKPGVSLAQAFVEGNRTIEQPAIDLPSFSVASSMLDALFSPDWADKIMPRAEN